MKQPLFILLFLSAISIMSCRKNRVDPDIKQYDQTQIQNYIAANGLTGMKVDPTGGDTTGIYYQLITPGTGPAIDYPDSVSFVFSIKSFDGKFLATDTISNHYQGFLGHVSPNGVMLGIHNLLKNKGGQIRMLIPSHLAFGVNGAGSGSSTITSGRIAGNQCLDYYVSLINRQDLYDDLSIRKYLTANNLTGYTKTDSGVYYKIITAGTGTTPIIYYSNVTATYTGQLLNGKYFDQGSQTTATTFNIDDIFVKGLVQVFEKYAVSGTSISVIIPSRLAYGTDAVSTSIPANSCLRFDYQISDVTQ